jgi:hypothetical protein
MVVPHLQGLDEPASAPPQDGGTRRPPRVDRDRPGGRGGRCARRDRRRLLPQAALRSRRSAVVLPRLGPPALASRMAAADHRRRRQRGRGPPDRADRPTGLRQRDPGRGRGVARRDPPAFVAGGARQVRRWPARHRRRPGPRPGRPHRPSGRGHRVRSGQAAPPDGRGRSHPPDGPGRGRSRGGVQRPSRWRLVRLRGDRQDHPPSSDRHHPHRNVDRHRGLTDDPGQQARLPGRRHRHAAGVDAAGLPAVRCPHRPGGGLVQPAHHAATPALRPHATGSALRRGCGDRSGGRHPAVV